MVDRPGIVNVVDTAPSAACESTLLKKFGGSGVEITTGATLCTGIALGRSMIILGTGERERDRRYRDRDRDRDRRESTTMHAGEGPRC